MAPPQCFTNGYAQLIHRYADLVLLLLIAALAWWLVGIDARITRNTDRLQTTASDASGAKERGEAILKRLDQIDSRLMIMDNRFYLFFGTRSKEGTGMSP